VNSKDDMGGCAARNISAEDRDKLKNDKKKSKDLELKMSEDHVADQAVNKLLLLGAGESGKSTLFKQMITIYGQGYSEEDRKSYVSIVWGNTIQAIKTLAERSAFIAPVQPQNEQARKFVNGLKEDAKFDQNVAHFVTQLWRDPGIQKTYEQKSTFQIIDSAKYFMERANEMAAPDYVPTEQDLLRTRVRTSGIVESAFEIDGNQFRMFDVGGQRNERKKWIHCFENVTAVLFVAAISAYDQVLYEDENTNRMVEALNLFEEICNSRWFRETAIILFLNKRDIFLEKISKTSLSVCFPEYKGEGYEEGVQFVMEMFESKNKNGDKQIYTHVTCATDTDNISKVFNAVKDIIIRKSLNEAGLV